MIAQKIDESKKLRTLLIAKIEKEWAQKWAGIHGHNFDFSNLKSQNLFLEQLQKDIENSLKAKIGQQKTHEILISRDNLRRIFNKVEPGRWQEKTRITILNYLDLDLYSEEEDNPKPTKSTNPNFLILSILIALTLVFFGVFFFYISQPKQAESISLSQDFSLNFPTQIKILADEKSGKELKFLKEPDKFMLDKIHKPTLLKNNVLNYVTPGLKNIKIIKNNKTIKNLHCLVGTNNGWYGCARLKIGSNPNVFAESMVKMSAWHGDIQETKNSAHLFLTTPENWQKQNNKNTQSKGYLAFDFKDFEQKGQKFSRVIFSRAQKFGIDLDSVSLSFRALRDNLVPEDCMSFQVSMIDKQNQIVELYSSNRCNAISNISVKSTNDNDDIEHYILFINQKVNLLLEDHQWHDINITLKNKHVLIYCDKKLVSDSKYFYNLDELVELNFIFEGNGKVDDVIIENSITQKKILMDDFN